MEILIDEPDYEWPMTDASHIKVHPHAVLAGMEPAIPPKKNRKKLRNYDKYLYKLHHLVENCFLALKQWREIVTRYAKTSDAFIAAVHIRCIAIWTAIRTQLE